MKNIFGRFLGGIMLSITGLIFLLFLTTTTAVNCRLVEPGSATCDTQMRLFGAVAVSQQTIGGVSGATVAESCDAESGCTYRVELETSSGVKPLTAYYSAGDAPKRALADQINRLVAGAGEPTLAASDSGFGWWVIIPLVFCFVGLVMLFSPLLAIVAALLRR